ncbi:PREDICTED: protein shisa-5-like [Cyphomyrmex costatus]|uniref:protein shisa-5-like n=1 Tax=Cyphomyrmex costatus TaxID=456900 RepID=UPI0008521E81|nr:PREDICTED: protein shisa-5-like [Cyphomyrmex costatus]
MLRLVVALLFTCLHMAHGIDCTFEFLEKTWLEKQITTCPRPFESKENNYCCIDVLSQSSYCCPFAEFTKKTGLGFIFPLVLAGLGIIFLITCCVSCFCCSCCPWYRRNPGMVYGKVERPVVQTIQFPANNTPSYTSQLTQNIPPSYTSQPIQNFPISCANQSTQNYIPPMSSTVMSQPPSYINEAYAKQAPYNPTYLPQ